jgi:hypothetical protein
MGVWGVGNGTSGTYGTDGTYDWQEGFERTVQLRLWWAAHTVGASIGPIRPRSPIPQKIERERGVVCLTPTKFFS